MAERRQDAMTGDWVLMAPGRAARPHAAAPETGCPFCPGNEAMLPEIIDEWPAADPPG